MAANQKAAVESGCVARGLAFIVVFVVVLPSLVGYKVSEAAVCHVKTRVTQCMRAQRHLFQFPHNIEPAKFTLRPSLSQKCNRFSKLVLTQTYVYYTHGGKGKRETHTDTDTQ